MKKLEDRFEDWKKNPPRELSFSLELDPKAYEEFFSHECKYTRKNNPVTGVSGGALTYEITPTTLGIVVHARCECGKKEDITDYRMW